MKKDYVWLHALLFPYEKEEPKFPYKELETRNERTLVSEMRKSGASLSTKEELWTRLLSCDKPYRGMGRGQITKAATGRRSSFLTENHRILHCSCISSFEL